MRLFHLSGGKRVFSGTTLKLRFLLTLFALFSAVPLVTCPVFAQQSARLAPADILIVHAKVYTLDPAKPWAQAIAIRHGKIQAVGRDEEVERYRGIGTKFVDAGGKLVLPGFTDCHVHFLEGSLALAEINLEGAKDVADLQKRLRGYAAKHPGDGWIQGRGWNYAMFGEATLPDKKYLDEIFPDRPVFLEGYDSHTSWVNSKALALAGITKSTPDPPHGAIVRDPKTGEATGALKEDADALIHKVIPEPNHVEVLTALRAGMKWANQNGITRVHSAGGDFEALPVLEELRQEKQLSVRFHVAYRLDLHQLTSEDLGKIESGRKKYHDDWMDVNSVKIMLDGVVESHTAALLAPYTDDPSKKGEMNWSPEHLNAAIAELDKRDVQIYTHAIGDCAVRTALDAYEFAEKKNHTKDHRNRIEHVETITTQDIPRFGKAWGDRQHAALTCLSGCGHAGRVGKKSRPGPCRTRLALEKHSGSRRAICVRQRLACCNAGSVDGHSDGGYSANGGGHAERRVHPLAAAERGAGGGGLHAGCGLRRAAGKNRRLDCRGQSGGRDHAGPQHL